MQLDARRLALALICAAVPLAADPARAQFSCPESEVLCIDFVEGLPAEIATGDLLTVGLTYAVKDGSWHDLRIELDVPEFFLGDVIFEAAPLWDEGCTLDNDPSFDTWKITCTWDHLTNPLVHSPGQSLTSNVEARMRSRPFQTPEGFEGLFTATLSGTRDGVPLSKTAFYEVTVNGHARLMHYPENVGGSTYVTRVIDGVPKTGRLYTYPMRPINNLGSNPTQTATSIPGGNALDDVQIHLDMPAYAYLEAIDVQLNAGNRWTFSVDGGAPAPVPNGGVDLPALVQGPNVHFVWTFAPLGRSGEAADWDEASTTGTWGTATSWVGVTFFIPCEVDGARGWPGLPLPSDGSLEPMRLRYSAVELITVEGSPDPIEVAHRWPDPAANYPFNYGAVSGTPVFYVGPNPATPTPYFVNSNVGCNSIIGTAAKSDSYSSTINTVRDFPHSGEGNEFNVAYLAPSLTTTMGPTLLLDMLSPWHRLGDPADIGFNEAADAGTEGVERVFTPYVCKLPRTLDAPLTSANATHNEPNSYRHVLDTTGGFPAPYTQIGRAAPWPMNETTPGFGCTTVARVAVEPTPGAGCGVLGPDFDLCSGDATALVWSSGTKNWTWVPDAAEPTNPNLHAPHLRVRFRTTIDPVVGAQVAGWSQPGTGLPDDPINANATNTALLYGAQFEAPHGTYTSLGIMSATPVPSAVRWPAGVSDTTWIRNRPAATVVASRQQADIAIGSEGQVGCHFIGVEELPLARPRVVLDMPPGFALAPADPSDWLNHVNLDRRLFEDNAVLLYAGLCLPGVGTPTVTVQTMNAGDPLAAFTRVTVDVDADVIQCWTSATFGSAMQFNVAPIAGHPFVQAAQYPFTCTLVADNLVDANLDPATPTATTTVTVPMSAGMNVDIDPSCDLDAGPAPSFLLKYVNANGTNLERAYAIFQVPSATLGMDGQGGGLPLAFGSAELLTHTGVAGLFYTTETPSPGATWLPMPPPVPADVRGVKVDFGTNVLPAWDATGRLRITLAADGFGAGHVGHWVRVKGSYGATTLGNTESQLSEVHYLGECPATLQVVKYHDHDRDGVRDPLEARLGGFLFELDVTVDSPIASAPLRDNPPLGLTGPPVVVDASDDRQAVSHATNATVYQVWPGQTVVVSELDVPRSDALSGGAAASAYGVDDVRRWDATAGTQRTHVQGFEDGATLEIGNACTCSTDDRCMTGTCTMEGACEWAAANPALDCEADVLACFAGTGACNPATGACGYEQTECLPGEPTKVNLLIEDAQGVLQGAVVCEHDASTSPATLACDVDEVTGHAVVTPDLTCGQTTDAGTTQQR